LQADEGGSAQAALAILQSFTEQHKKRALLDSMKESWQREQLQLHKLEAALSRDLVIAAADIAAIATAADDDLKQLSLSEQECAMQCVTELRSSMREWSHNSLNSSEHNAAIAAMLAAQLCDVREQLHAESEQLCVAETALTEELHKIRQHISAFLSEDKHDSGAATDGAAAFLASIGNFELESAVTDADLPLLLLRNYLMQQYTAIHSDCAAAIAEAAAACDASCNSVASADGTIEHGDWSGEEHFVFTKLLKAANSSSKSASTAKTAQQRSVMLNRMQLELPHRTRSELLEHEQWCRQYAVLNSKKASITAGRDAAIAQLANSGQKQLKDAVAASKEATLRAHEAAIVAEKRAVLHAKLHQLQQAHAARESELALYAAAADNEAAQREQLQQQQQAEAQAQRHAAVQAYRESLAVQAAAQRDAAAAAAVEQATAKALRMASNEKRLQYRQQQAAAKQARAVAAAAAADELELKRQALIQKLAQSVPYYEALLNAQSDIHHVTAAAAAHAQQFEHIDTARGHHPMFGFDTNKVFKHAGFRLGLALRAAGVSHTAAARDAVARITHRTPAPF
jgi:trimeric autotransporter adhesin